MTKWEYRYELIFLSDFEVILNRWGREGWELIQYSFDTGHALLKRHLKEDTTLQVLSEILHS